MLAAKTAADVAVSVHNHHRHTQPPVWASSALSTHGLRTGIALSGSFEIERERGGVGGREKKTERERGEKAGNDAAGWVKDKCSGGDKKEIRCIEIRTQSPGFVSTLSDQSGLAEGVTKETNVDAEVGFGVGEGRREEGVGVMGGWGCTHAGMRGDECDCRRGSSQTTTVTILPPFTTLARLDGWIK